MPETENGYWYEMLPGQNPEGQHIFSVLVKRTYDIRRGEKCKPSEDQMRLLPADKFFDNGDPVTASCEAESDFIPYKVATDVVVIGKAYSAGGKNVQALEATLKVGEYQKTIWVIGDRRCQYRAFGGHVFSDPEPFASMELRYERAYGGVDIHSQEGNPLIYPRNPIGRGFVIKNIKEAIDGLLLPNLEEPGNRITADRLVVGKMENWHKQPLPQGFGWFSKNWYPRCTFAGVMPADMPLYETMREATLGYVPKDQVEGFKKMKLPLMDFKFFNGASPGLIVPYLKGDEISKLTNMDPDGEFEFQLPGDSPAISVDIGDGPQKPEVILHTVAILKEENKLYLVWRGAVKYPGPEYMQKLTKLEIKVE